MNFFSAAIFLPNSSTTSNTPKYTHARDDYRYKQYNHRHKNNTDKKYTQFYTLSISRTYILHPLRFLKGNIRLKVSTKLTSTNRSLRAKNFSPIRLFVNDDVMHERAAKSRPKSY